jgi:glycosyltransferase 2 family protein
MKWLKNSWKFWLGIVIGTVFLYFALRELNWNGFWIAIKTANYWWLIPGILIYFIGVWVRAWRWHYLLHPVKPISTQKMFPVVTIGYAGNNIFPARAGEVLRAVILKRQEDVSISASLATIIVERIFDAVVMMAFVFVNLPELANLTANSGFIGNIKNLAVIGTVIFFGALVVFLIAAMFPRKTAQIGTGIISRFLPQRLQQQVLDLMHKFLDGLASLRSPANILMIFLTSVVIWLLETGKYWFVMHAFEFRVTFFALMLTNGLVNLATTIPGAPGYIGTWEAVISAVLIAYQVPRDQALGYAVVLHMALWLPITLLGSYYLAKEGIRWGTNIDALARQDSSENQKVQ